MLSEAMLDGVRKIVVHGPTCADGLASAVLLYDAYGGRIGARDIEFVAYESERHLTMPAEPGMLFCDFSPPLSRADEFVRAGTIVLDHHEAERVAPYGERGVFSNAPGVSGAVLAFREVWCRRYAHHPLHGEVFDNVEQFAFRAGVYDTWQKQLEPSVWRTACEQAEVLRFFPRSDWLPDRGPIDWSAVDSRLAIGPSLLKKREERSRALLKGAYAFTSRRGRRIVVIGSRETDMPADMLEEENARAEASGVAPATALIGFEYSVDAGTPKMKLSCRSASTLSVLPFTQSFPGGGGHARAAGFTVPVAFDGSPRETNPYRLIEDLWNHWEGSE